MEQHHNAKSLAYSLHKFSAAELEGLLSDILREMRRRDSDDIKRDAINASRSLRAQRLTTKLP